MNNVNLFPHKKNRAATGADGSILLNTDKIAAIEEKLDDPEYMDAAIYRLASIIADRILDGGFGYEQEKI